MAATLVPVDGGSPIVLEKQIILIGRHQDCDIPLPAHAKVSRRHCCIVQAGERYVVRDLGSMNGLRVNGHRVNESELQPGDELSVADAVFIFRGALQRSGPRPSGEQSGPSDSASGSSSPAPIGVGDDEQSSDRDNRRSTAAAGKSSDSHTGQKFAEV
ncbi:MAG: FHA domain-containing protein [Planctomycetaceae bacterium]|nr:MAG: FHA domain-containing protein [Planctomycetaceae bacterium]